MCWTAQPSCQVKVYFSAPSSASQASTFPSHFCSAVSGFLLDADYIQAQDHTFLSYRFLFPLSEKHGRKKRNQISRQGFGSGFCRKCSSEWHLQLHPCFHVLNLKPMNSVATPTTKHQDYHQCLLQPRSPYYRPFCGLGRLLIFSVFPVLGTWIKAV